MILILSNRYLLLSCLLWPITDDGLCVASVYKLLTLSVVGGPGHPPSHSGPFPGWMLHLPSVVTCFLQLGSICSEGNCVKWTLEKMPPAFTKFYKCPHDLDLSWLCQACLCESTLPFFFSACTLVLQFTFLLQWGGKNSNLTFYIEIQSGKEIQAPIIISISHLH